MKKLLLASLLLIGILFPQSVQARDYYQVPNRTKYFYDEETDKWIANGGGSPIDNFDNAFYYNIYPKPGDRIIPVDYEGNPIGEPEVVVVDTTPTQNDTGYNDTYEYAVYPVSMQEKGHFQSWNGQQVRFNDLGEELWVMTRNGQTQDIDVYNEPLLNITVNNGIDDRTVKVNTVLRHKETHEVLAYAFHNRDGGISLALPEENSTSYTEYDSLKFNPNDTKTINPEDYPEFARHYYVSESDLDSNVVVILAFYGPVMHLFNGGYGIELIGDEYRQLDSGDYVINLVNFYGASLEGLISTNKIHYDEVHKKIEISTIVDNKEVVETYVNIDDKFEDYYRKLTRVEDVSGVSFENYYQTSLKQLGDIDYRSEIWHAVKYIDDPNTFYKLTDNRIDWSKQ
ncbi:hypothetical protein JDW15_01640 [Aerococcaceae bacterium zg-ZJ1578]|uniref:hypothetical protein n=1 Tax=Aerococcaceae bacterium zg-252 TaxID=2796928 RepID=UPI001A321203|nr:hypothetical protein [Aerococcaceae bacterium zg-1578]